ncbi:hypothetical protein LSAT2_023925 [Lamellibrachia satsuma]|nr:hypothetical protein LSAT2_023925 [Lamellibrachia satsuma]
MSVHNETATVGCSAPSKPIIKTHSVNVIDHNSNTGRIVLRETNANSHSSNTRRIVLRETNVDSLHHAHTRLSKTRHQEKRAIRGNNHEWHFLASLKKGQLISFVSCCDCKSS